MSRRWIHIAFIGLAVVTAGCAGMIIRQDWKRDYDFSKFATYSWLTPPAKKAESGDRIQIERNDFLQRRIMRAVDAQLQQRGYKVDAANPDFLVAFHTGLEDKINVVEWGYRYGPGPWGWSSTERDISLQNYRKGTLVLDFINAGTRELVWRGEAQDAVENRLSLEKLDKLLDRAVTEMLKKFPPVKE